MVLNLDSIIHLYGNHGENKKKQNNMSNFYRISPTDGINFGSGFFSNYRITLAKLIYQHYYKSDKIPYIDWGDTAWVEGYNPFNGDILIRNENPFDFWFDQTIPNENDIITTLNGVNPLSIINHTLDYSNNPLELNKQKTIDKLYIKPKQFLIDKVDEIYNTEFKDEIVLGVIARGCEFFHWHPNYGVFTIDDYINNVKGILKNNPQITKLFFVSEDSNYINRLKNEFPNSYFMPNIFRRTNEEIEYMNRVYLWPNVDTKRPNQNKLLGEETIIQTKLLGKCDYLLGMHSGIFAGAILWNENIKQIYKM